jgi:hypothetical protein
MHFIECTSLFLGEKYAFFSKNFEAMLSHSLFDAVNNLDKVSYVRFDQCQCVILGMVHRY